MTAPNRCLRSSRWQPKRYNAHNISYFLLSGFHFSPTYKSVYIISKERNKTYYHRNISKSAIESNIQRALYLSDESAIGYYRNLQEKGYFNRMIAGNISQTLTVDSIQGNFNSYPYEMKTYSRQHIIRSSSVTQRSLVTTCRLRNVTRSDNNPQGFLIESFTIIENKDIGQYER